MEKKKFIIDDKLVFWSGLLYFIIMVLFVLLKIFAYIGLFSWTGGGYLFRILVQIGLMGILPILIFKLFAKQTFKQTFNFFSFRAISWKSVFISLLLGLCLFIIIGYISSFWGGILSLFGYKIQSSSGDYSVFGFIMSILMVGVLPGICEEIAHRGLVLNSIKRNGAIRAIVLCGLLFGLMHFNVAQFGYAFVAGMFFCFITLICKSIYPAMIMHFTNNAFSTIVTYSQKSTWMNGGIMEWVSNFLYSGNMLAVILINTLIIILVSTLISYLVVKLFAESKKMHFKRFQKNLQKELQNTEVADSVNVTDNTQAMELFQQVNMLNVKQKIEQGTFTSQDLTQGMNTKKMAELLLSDNMTLPKKRFPANYIFYYCAIFLGSVGTFFTFILGII